MRVTFDITGLPVEPDTMTVFMGKAVRDTPVRLDSINQDSGRVTVWGDIFLVDKRFSRDGSKCIYAIHFTDYTSSNTLKLIVDKDQESAMDELKSGVTVAARGEVDYDKYDHEIAIRPYDICLLKKKEKKDTAEK